MKKKKKKLKKDINNKLKALNKKLKKGLCEKMK